MPSCRSSASGASPVGWTGLHGLHRRSIARSGWRGRSTPTRSRARRPARCSRSDASPPARWTSPAPSPPGWRSRPRARCSGRSRRCRQRPWKSAGRPRRACRLLAPPSGSGVRTSAATTVCRGPRWIQPLSSTRPAWRRSATSQARRRSRSKPWGAHSGSGARTCRRMHPWSLRRGCPRALPSGAATGGAGARGPAGGLSRVTAGPPPASRALLVRVLLGRRAASPAVLA
mmetsp:Transcript_31724/g.94488  ORF Transcript_31724/g.94488 Transcript_31724/m.94488 type:complete len:230 (-) Transcript_31724:95-784(-)